MSERERGPDDAASAAEQEAQGRSQRVLGAAGKMSGAMGVGFFLNLVGNLVLARILKTADVLGVWRTVQLVLQYTLFLNLGASHGLDRAGATMISRGQLARYRQTMGASLGMSLVLPIVASIAIICALPFMDSLLTRIGAIALVFLIPLQQLQIYGDMALVFEKKYGLRAKATFGYTVLRIPMTLLLAWWIGLSGALIAFVVSVVFYSFYTMRRSEMGWQVFLHGRFAKHMVTTGLPITLLAFGDMVIQTVDKWMVLFMGHETAMGLYSMAIFPLPLLMLLPSSLRDAMNMEIYDYARRKGNAEGVRALYSHTLQMIALGSPVVMGVVFYGVPWLIKALLPADIHPSIPAVEMHAVAIFPLLLAQTGLAILVTSRLEVRSVLITGTLALISAGTTWALFKHTSIVPPEVEGDPLHLHEQAILRLVLSVHACVWAVYALFLLTLNHWKFGMAPMASFARSVVYFIPMIVAGFALYAIQWIMQQSPLVPYTFANAAVSGMLYLVVCAPGILYLEKRYKSLSAILSAVKRRMPGLR